jgi:hypothetical protein
MELGTIAGAVTAIATMITAIGGLLVAIKVLIPNFKQTKEVHEIVNQQRTDMQKYMKVLENALSAHGIDIPVDQSKIDTEN